MEYMAHDPGRAAGRSSRLITKLFIFILFVSFTGLIPVRSVFAASQEVSIPYRQQWTNVSGEDVNSSFEYRLTAVDGAPLPDEASGEYYSFVLNGNDSGSLDLHFPFAAPGYYNYHVNAYISDDAMYYRYDKATYDLMIMVINSEDGLAVGAMTIQDESLAKYPELPFSMAYVKGLTDPEEIDPAEDDPAEEEPVEDEPAEPDGGNGGRSRARRPGAAAAGTVLGDPETPTAIPERETPLGILPEPEDWALLNLILMVLTVILALADALLYFRNPTDKYGEEYKSEDEDEEDIRRHGFPRILALITAAVSVILFFLTEDMTDPMIWVDEFTVWMLILFIITALLVMMSKKNIDDDQEGEMGGAATGI